jgi:hypothetical protein
MTLELLYGTDPCKLRGDIRSLPTDIRPSVRNFTRKEDFDLAGGTSAIAAITSKFVALAPERGGLPPDGLEYNCINDARVSVLPLGVSAQAQIA